MAILDNLSKNARPSIGHYIDKYVREVVGHIQGSYTDDDVTIIYAKVKSRYDLAKEKPKDFYFELKQLYANSTFVREVREEIIRFIENRPEPSRYDYYVGLCTKGGLAPKVIANKEKLENRIDVLIRTDCKSQDV